MFQKVKFVIWWNLQALLTTLVSMELSFYLTEKLNSSIILVLVLTLSLREKDCQLWSTLFLLLFFFELCLFCSCLELYFLCSVKLIPFCFFVHFFSVQTFHCSIEIPFQLIERIFLRLKKLHRIFVSWKKYWQFLIFKSLILKWKRQNVHFL